MIILHGNYLVQISGGLSACPKDYDLEVFKKINQLKFCFYGINAMNVDVAAGWALTRKTRESTRPCLLVRITGAKAYTPVIEYGIVDCSARHPYIHFVLQKGDSGHQETLLINTNVYSLNYKELHKAWKRTELFKVVKDNFAKKLNKTDVICMQVEKGLENFEDTLAKKKKALKEETSVATQWTQQKEALSVHPPPHLNIQTTKRGCAEEEAVEASIRHENALVHFAKPCKGLHDLHAVKDAKLQKAMYIAELKFELTTYIAELKFELITEQSELDAMGDPDLCAVKIKKLQKAIYIEELKLKLITAERKLNNLNALGDSVGGNQEDF